MRKRRYRRGVSCAAFSIILIGIGAACAITYSSLSGKVSAAVSSPSSQRRTTVSRSTAAISATAEHTHELVLVNRDNPVPSWYKLNLTDYDTDCQMDAAAADAFYKMKTDASRDGITLWISSAYRSNSLQRKLHQQEIEEYQKTSPNYDDAKALAERSVVPPGCSEHETGLAMDLNGVKDNFDQSEEFRWLGQHAQDYGFILRYPKEKENITRIKYEPWHYRYVGIANAQAIKKSGLCLEEYEAQKAKGAH